jgi:aryl-alcohol dehydrogenase-like predicted oxidoreductase
MEYRFFAALNQKISVIGFGGWAIGGESIHAGRHTGWGPADPAEARSALRRALELGVNFFDTADVYGKGTSEQLIGDVVGNRPDTVICTKFGNREAAGAAAMMKDFSSDWVVRSVEASMRRLRRERIDLLLLHSPPDDFPWTSYDVAPLEELKRKGMIRAFGVSCHGLRGAQNVLKAGFGTAIEIIYNAFDRRSERHVLPESQSKGVSVIARVPLASGYLTGKLSAATRFPVTDVRSQISDDEHRWRLAAVDRLSFLRAFPGGMGVSALRYCISNPAVSTVIPGMRTISQVEENCLAGNVGVLQPDTIKQIRDAVPVVYSGWPTE